LEKLVTPCKKCLEDAKVSKVDEVILVGGMTRMPSIREKVKEIFGKEPNKSVNPDEAVALGAAVQGAVLSGESKEGIVLLDVTPLSLGIETFGGIFTRLIKRNTTIPAGNKQIFSTAVDNQPEVTIRVFQGERELAKDNHFLKQFALSGIRPASKGVPQIEVTFDIDSNGILSITAKDITDPNNVKEVKEIVENIQGGLSEKEVDEMIKKAEASAEKDQELRANIEKLNQARDYLYNFEKQIKEFEKLKDEPQFQEFQKLYENLKEAVDKGDKGDFSQIETALEKIAEMSKVAEELKKKIPKEDEKKDNEDKDKK
jgi:molecular chaperone DnaK